MKVKDLKNLINDVRIDENSDIQIGTANGVYQVKSVSYFPNAMLLCINVITEQQLETVIDKIKTEAIKEKLKANLQ